jgi:hypothetical protein
MGIVRGVTKGLEGVGMAMQDHEIAAYNGQRVTITFNEYDEHPKTGRMEVSGRFSGTGRLIFRPACVRTRTAP